MCSLPVALLSFNDLSIRSLVAPNTRKRNRILMVPRQSRTSQQPKVFPLFPENPPSGPFTTSHAPAHSTPVKTRGKSTVWPRTCGILQFGGGVDGAKVRTLRAATRERLLAVGPRGAAGFSGVPPGLGRRGTTKGPGRAAFVHSPVDWERDGGDSSSTSCRSSAESARVERMVGLARGLRAGGCGAGAGSRAWTAGASAPLGEAWRQPRTPESRSGGSSCLPQSWSGTRSQQRGAKVAVARAVSARLQPRARCCDDSRPVPSALASAPSPRSSPTAAAGSGGAAAGRALGCEQ